MSEPIEMTIEIGGILKEELIDELIIAINDDIYDITGGDDWGKNIRKSLKSLIITGTANYGECANVKSFCRDNALNYLHMACGNGVYDGTLSFYIPGILFNTEKVFYVNSQNDIIIFQDEIKPLFNFMLWYANTDNRNYPPPEQFHEIDGLIEAYNSNKILSFLQDQLQRFMPDIPQIPPLIIKKKDENISMIINNILTK
jgi:hypothetical protein